VSVAASQPHLDCGLAVHCDSGLSAARFIHDVCVRLHGPQVWYRKAGSGDSLSGAKLVQPRKSGQPPWKEGVTGDVRGVAF
jgi:hypothetical protein